MPTLSALELEFQVHYREMDRFSGRWTGLRVRKLCNLLKMTQPEFARFIRVSPSQLQKWIETEKWPSPIKLLLDLVERSAFRTYLGTTYKQTLFPEGTI